MLTLCTLRAQSKAPKETPQGESVGPLEGFCELNKSEKKKTYVDNILVSQCSCFILFHVS